MAKTTLKTKKPPAATLQQEALEYTNKTKIPLPKGTATLTQRQLIASNVLSGLLASGKGSMRSAEIVEESYRYADLILQYKK